MTEAADAVADAVTKTVSTKDSPAPPLPDESPAGLPPPDQRTANGVQDPAAEASFGEAEVCPISRRYGAPVQDNADERQSTLWQVWKLIGMPIFYPLFAVGCGIGLLGAGLIRLSVRSPRSRVMANRRLLSAIVRRWLRLGCWLRLLEWEALRPVAADGDGAQPPPSGRLLVANHPTLIDVLFMVALEPTLCCVLKADLNRHWVFARFIRELDYLSNADPEQLLEEGAERLRRGETLLVFPEGTRTVPGSAVVFRPGAAAIAICAGLPLQPVVIEYQGAYLSKGYPWYALPKQRMRYRFRYGPPLFAPAVAEGDTQVARSHRRRARRHLNAALEQFTNAQLAASTLPAPPAAVTAARRPLTPLRGADL